jgi:hypothetical protein
MATSAILFGVGAAVLGFGGGHDLSDVNEFITRVGRFALRLGKHFKENPIKVAMPNLPMPVWNASIPSLTCRNSSSIPTTRVGLMRRCPEEKLGLCWE